MESTHFFKGIVRGALQDTLEEGTITTNLFSTTCLHQVKKSNESEEMFSIILARKSLS